jgi:4-amino-4-deoxy-L-arabinose transferase-like glycosyltransferase
MTRHTFFTQLARLISTHQRIISIILATIIVTTSLTMAIHNALLYNPSNGFDGYGHQEYVYYLAQERQMPPPTGWETHQPPLYYIITATIYTIFSNPKSIQFVNIAVFWLIITVVGLGLHKIFKEISITLIGMLALVALPMLNIFLPTVTNELLSTFWIISAIVSCIYIYHAQNTRQRHRAYIALLICLVLAVWTKISVITIIPLVLLALYLSIPRFAHFLIYSAIALSVFSIAYIPIYLRASTTSSPSNITQTTSNIILSDKRSPDFYYRLDWIPKADMYTTQYYSLLGGAWNSFWTDGHNIATPFVTFHKKALILWSLGFLLFPLSLYGLWSQFHKHKQITLIMAGLGASMLGFFLLYNIASNHYSAVRLTYQMPIVLAYAYGIAAAARHKRLAPIILALLLIQFVTLISFFWIEPWWFVTSPKQL